MINNENDKDEKKPVENNVLTDVAKMDIQAHILIKDKDTGEVLLNKRG